VRPAINVGISVSRVGGNAQIKPMKKVAGRLKLDLSQFRELEAFAQFGSDLDPDTQRTLARGERLVRTLNQNERAPVPVAEQVVIVYAATNGYVDRINTERVEEFNEGLQQRLRSENGDLLETIAGGDWSDETISAVEQAVSGYADDFGYDLDEEGQPQESTSDGAPAGGGGSPSGEAGGQGADEQPAPQADADGDGDQQGAGAGAVSMGGGAS
jgi:F-type H+-transporting ATPase subunit alpha